MDQIFLSTLIDANGNIMSNKFNDNEWNTIKNVYIICMQK